MLMFFSMCTWWFLLFRDESSVHFVRSLYCITTSLGLSGAALAAVRLLLKGYLDPLSSISMW